MPVTAPPVAPAIVRVDAEDVYRGALRGNSRKKQFAPLQIGDFFLSPHPAKPKLMVRLGKFVKRVNDLTIKVRLLYSYSQIQLKIDRNMTKTLQSVTYITDNVCISEYI
jgi:hypothetical protein